MYGIAQSLVFEMNLETRTLGMVVLLLSQCLYTDYAKETQRHTLRHTQRDTDTERYRHREIDGGLYITT